MESFCFCLLFSRRVEQRKKIVDACMRLPRTANIHWKTHECVSRVQRVKALLSTSTKVLDPSCPTHKHNQLYTFNNTHWVDSKMLATRLRTRGTLEGVELGPTTGTTPTTTGTTPTTIQRLGRLGLPIMWHVMWVGYCHAVTTGWSFSNVNYWII